MKVNKKFKSDDWFKVLLWGICTYAVGIVCFKLIEGQPGAIGDGLTKERLLGFIPISILTGFIIRWGFNKIDKWIQKD